MIRTRELSLSPAGEAGEAVAEATIGVDTERLVAVGVNYTGVPETTDVTISNQGRTLLARSNSNTDGFFQLAAAVSDSAGAAVEGAFAQAPAVHGEITIAVAGADEASDGVAVLLLLED